MRLLRALRRGIFFRRHVDLMHSFETRTGPAGRPGHETGPGLSKNPPGSWPGRPGTRQTRVNPVVTRLFFMLFHCSIVEVPTDVEVIPYSAYAILTIEQQKREQKKTITEILCIKLIS